MVEKLRNLNAVARTRFKVARSSIHGWGLFVKEPIPKGEMLIEYQGFLIRASLNESMLRQYTSGNVFGATDGSYIFRVDEDTQVDATMAGNIARFMNHSCAPNCYSRIVEVGKGIGDKHIVVFAMRANLLGAHELKQVALRRRAVSFPSRRVAKMCCVYTRCVGGPRSRNVASGDRT